MDYASSVSSFLKKLHQKTPKLTASNKDFLSHAMDPNVAESWLKLNLSSTHEYRGNVRAGPQLILAGYFLGLLKRCLCWIDGLIRCSIDADDDARRMENFSR